MEEQKNISLEQAPVDPSVEQAPIDPSIEQEPVDSSVEDDSSVSVPKEPSEEFIEEGGFLDPVDPDAIDWDF